MFIYSELRVGLGIPGDGPVLMENRNGSQFSAILTVRRSFGTGNST